MYAEDVKAISEAMRADPEIFARGILFALLSIRQPITMVPEMLADVAETGDASRYLFGFKFDGFKYLERNKHHLWEIVCRVPLDCPRDAIRYLAQCPGLGIVKAAFVAQFLGFDVACLDSRNVKLEKRKPRAFRADKKSGKLFEKRLAKYVRETSGKAEFYWDRWCNYVGEIRGYTGAEISALHLAILDHAPNEREAA